MGIKGANNEPQARDGVPRPMKMGTYMRLHRGTMMFGVYPRCRGRSRWRDRPYGEIDRFNHQFRSANAISGRRASTCPNGRRHP